MSTNLAEIPLEKSPMDERIVVSLTTIPDRIEYIQPTLVSLLTQSIPPTEIALNIPIKTRKGLSYTIPSFLINQNRIKIYRVPVDEGPATKLLPTLRREKPNTIIVVVDDDMIYPPNMIERLLEKFNYYKRRAAIATYGTLLSEDNQLPSIPSICSTAVTSSEELDFLYGFAGYLVTPAMFHPDVFALLHPDTPKEAISVDDIWFSGWLRLNGTKIMSAGYAILNLSLPVWGQMSKTTALHTGENKEKVPDQITTDWFIQVKGLKPVYL